MKINIKNAEKVNAALNEAQKGTSARRMDADDLARLISKFESAFPAPKTAMTGLWVHAAIGFGGSKPSSYKGVPYSTYATVERFPSGWFLTNAGRAYAPAGEDRVEVVGGRTAELDAAILDRAFNKIYH